MKICLLGDTHFGVRNDSKAFHAYYEKFYSNNLFPYLKENNIDTIIQLGDLFDRRKYINFHSLSESRRYFFDPIEDAGIKLITLIGNHDIFWKESINVNSPDLLLKDYGNITIFQKPGKIVIDNISFDIIPWICKENESIISSFINESTSDYCIGHFEISGFQMMKGIDNHEGFDRKYFKQYNQVFSGHFHTKSSEGNINYLGTPYELTWNDESDPKGFFIFDTSTKHLEFIKNPYTIFTKFYYNDETTDPDSINVDVFLNQHVKLIVVKKKDFHKFDQFVERIYRQDPIELKIIEDFSEFESEALDDSINLEDTMTLLSEYVDSVDTDANKDRLKTLLKTLYVEAQHYEDV
jgi:DNA repair exonuclease SbcCD nuclease subunit